MEQFVGRVLLSYLVAFDQCDQIWRFIAHWATLLSRWQQLFSPKLPTLLGNFRKGVNIFSFFLRNHFWASL